MGHPSSYADAGVDRDQEEQAVTSIIEMIKLTHANSSVSEGHYAGSIPLGDQILSLANDGVGSKLILAQQLNKLDTIGIDAVAMCVNDLICMGSIPAAFVDYIAIRYPDEELIIEIMKGLVEGCLQAEIPLVGGETATLPEVLQPVVNNNGFDVAGTALGIQHQTQVITGEKIQPGDKIIAIRSNGIHSNGLTLARKLVEYEEDEHLLLKPTRIYVKVIKALLETITPTGMAHITGGGITNLFRLGKFHYNLHKADLLNIPTIFSRLQEAGSIELKEMYRTFNMGIGFIVIVRPDDEVAALQILNNFYPSSPIGEVQEGELISVQGDTLVEFIPERRD